MCDKEQDCPGGEDEAYCYGIQNNHHSDGYYEVMKQDNGIWHTKCFLKSKPPTESDLVELCKKLGYIDPISPKARTRVDNDTGKISSVHLFSISHLNKNKILVMAVSSDAIEMITKTHTNGTTKNDEPPATKATLFNKFTTLEVNDKIKFYIKPSRPVTRLVEWDENDEKKCLRLEIKC